MPASLNTILMHWFEAGVWDEMEVGAIVSLTVEPPQIMISGV
jgi:hypothetical protein